MVEPLTPTAARVAALWVAAVTLTYLLVRELGLRLL